MCESWQWEHCPGLEVRPANAAKNPGFTLVAALTLALGIGANTSIFSVINATLLRPIPFPDSDRLVLVWATYGKGPDNWNIVSAPNYWDFRRRSHSFEGMAIFDSGGRGYNLSAAGTKQQPEQVSGLRVSANFFSVLGVQPYLGRVFLSEEEALGKDREVVLSYGLWKRRYEGDPTLVGRTIKIDGEDFTVVGVMPRDFQWQFWSGPAPALGARRLYQGRLRSGGEQLHRLWATQARRDGGPGGRGDGVDRRAPCPRVSQRRPRDGRNCDADE